MCLDDAEILELIEGRLTPETRALASTHLDECDECRALVADATRTFLDLARHGRDTDQPEEPDLQPEAMLARGEIVGRYRIEGRLGAGGMGIVYLAHDPELDRKVAVKILRADLGGTSQAARQAVLREAQAMARLSSPNVAAIYDIGTVERRPAGQPSQTPRGDAAGRRDEGAGSNPRPRSNAPDVARSKSGDSAQLAGALGERVFIAMEYVEGTTLSRWLRESRRGWREVLAVFTAAARGLAVAHRTGLVHRDFKPDNVLVGAEGRVCVTDFGLARLYAAGRGAPASEVDAKRERAPVGTPRYMAPEQARGGVVDARADEFSFCVALYEALYRARPFAGATLADRVRAAEAGPPRPPRARVPSWVARAVRRGLAARPDARFPTMDALIAALAGPWWRRTWPAAALAVVAVGAVGFGIASRRPAVVPPRTCGATTAGEIFVDAAAPAEGGTGGADCPFRTISRALTEAAATPDRHVLIHVAAGTYDRTLGERFPLFVRGDLTLLGAGEDVTLVTGSARFDPRSQAGNLEAVNFTFVVGDSDKNTEIGGMTISSGSAVAAGFQGVLCDRGNLREYHGAAEPSPASTLLHDVTIGPGYSDGVDVAISGSDAAMSGCNLRAVRTTLRADDVGIWTFGCGEQADTPLTRAIAVGLVVDHSAFDAIRAIGINQWDCTAFLTVTASQFENSSVGIAAVRHDPGPANLIIEDNLFRSLSGAGIQLVRGAGVRRLVGNTFVGINGERTAQAADRAAAIVLDADNQVDTFPQIELARDNHIIANDVGIALRGRSPIFGTLDFGQPADPGNNVIRCNATTVGSAVLGHDLLIDAPVAADAKLLFSGNVWDHLPPTTDASVNGADVVTGPRALPQLDTSAPRVGKDCPSRYP